MSDFIVALLEDWNNPSASEHLKHLREMTGGDEAVEPTSSALIARALLARLESSGMAAPPTADEVLQSFAFLCQQFWSPMHDFTLNLLST